MSRVWTRARIARSVQRAVPEATAFLWATEFFLLENRSRASSHYDRNIPGEGLLIWHAKGVDADLECADGKWLNAGYPEGEQADGLNGEDNLDFWAHDATYRQAHAGNKAMSPRCRFHPHSIQNE